MESLEALLTLKFHFLLILSHGVLYSICWAFDLRNLIGIMWKEQIIYELVIPSIRSIFEQTFTHFNVEFLFLPVIPRAPSRMI
jgi:hypothetical protein